MIQSGQNAGRWFIYFYLYNLLFFFFQLLFIFSKGIGFVQAIPLPWVVIAELAITLIIHLSLYLILAIIQTALLWGIVKRNLSSYFTFDHWQLFIWLVSIFAILSANIYFFPLSAFSKLFLPELPLAVINSLLFLSVAILSLLLLNTFLVLPRKQSLALSIFFGLVILIAWGGARIKARTHVDRELPNIIIIGIDSLSPNHINNRNTPFLAHYLEKSVLFSDTISPLAHTFPSWMSILTGLYPFHHKATYNLISTEGVAKDNSIAWDLKKRGYTTIYATDDRRFNSIDETFGFDQIIGPQKGANDVILGGFNDFPLSNLIVNLAIGRALFPYNHMNRASFYTYYPRTFDLALQRELNKENKRPLFLAVHFALPHWPYAWAVTRPEKVNDVFDVEMREGVYYDALAAVDEQVSHLFYFLQQSNYLNNSMIFLLSDHGETLYLPGTRQTSLTTYQGKQPSKLAEYFKRKTSTAIDMSVGHGSDLLSSDQYHCLLATRIYKNGQLVTIPRTIRTRVSLIDIMPTIAHFLGLPIKNPVDGISLYLALNKESKLPERAFFMESGMLPNQFVNQEKARILGKKYFTISSDGQLILKKDELPTLDALKLYAVIKKDWIFALYPDDRGYIPVILHLTNNNWSDSLGSPFAKKTPAKDLLESLSNFYQKKWKIAP